MSNGSIDRMLKLAERLYTGGDLTHRYVQETHAVSRETAKRDLVRVEANLPVQVGFRHHRASGSPEKVLTIRKGGA